MQSYLHNYPRLYRGFLGIGVEQWQESLGHRPEFLGAGPFEKEKHLHHHPQPGQQRRFGEPRGPFGPFQLPPTQLHQGLTQRSGFGARVPRDLPDQYHAYRRHQQPLHERIGTLLRPLLHLLAGTLKQLVIRLDPPTPVVPQRHRRRRHTRRHIAQQPPPGQHLPLLVSHLCNHQPQRHRLTRDHPMPLAFVLTDSVLVGRPGQ